MTNTGRQPRRPPQFNVSFTRQFMTSAPTGGDVTKAPPAQAEKGEKQNNMHICIHIYYYA